MRGEFEGIVEELIAGEENRREDRLVISADVGAVAAPDFAVHDRRTNRGNVKGCGCGRESGGDLGEDLAVVEPGIVGDFDEPLGTVE